MVLVLLKFLWLLAASIYAFPIPVETSEDDYLLLRDPSYKFGDTNPTNAMPSIDSGVFRVCANNTYQDGNVDITSTLYACVANMADPICVPRYVVGLPVYNAGCDLYFCSFLFTRVVI
jgi:hypothetical protein